jgi:hypothetical protein
LCQAEHGGVVPSLVQAMGSAGNVCPRRAGAVLGPLVGTQPVGRGGDATCRVLILVNPSIRTTSNQKGRRAQGQCDDTLTVRVQRAWSAAEILTRQSTTRVLRFRTLVPRGGGRGRTPKAPSRATSRAACSPAARSRHLRRQRRHPQLGGRQD